MKQIIVVLIFVNLLLGQVKAQEVPIKILDWAEPVLGASFSPDQTVAVAWSEHSVYCSRNDNLNSWDPVTVGFAKINDMIVIDNMTIYMIGDKGFISKSNDAGIHWNLLPAMTEENLNRIKVTAQGTFILGDNGLLLKSIDSGNSWKDFSINTSTSLKDIQFFHGSYTGLVVGDKKSFRTTDSGENWSLESLPYNLSGIKISIPDIQELYPDFQDVHFIIGMVDLEGGEKVPAIIKRDRAGLILTVEIPQLSYEPTDIAFKGLIGYAIANKSDGLFMRTVDGGVSWIGEYRQSRLYSITIVDNRVIVTGDNGTIYVRNNTITNISNITEAPSSYSLLQNYPNPFNPTTKISFSIPVTGFTKLSVYDVSGREVVKLVNEVKAAGSYSVSFSGSNLASGVYYYTLSAKSFTETKKNDLD
jgi:hypothetical protein